MNPQLKAAIITFVIFLSLGLFVFYLSMDTKDFSKIKIGMSYEDVKNKVGSPKESVVAPFGINLLMYSEGYVIIIINDKVTNIKTKAEFIKDYESMMVSIGEAKKGIEKWDSKKKEMDKKMENFQNTLNNQ